MKKLFLFSALIISIFFLTSCSQQNKDQNESLIEEKNDSESAFKIYKNEEYGFEFKYPIDMAAIEFNEKTQGCDLTLVYYDSRVVEEAVAKNPPDKKPDASLKFSACLINEENAEDSIEEFIKSRYYNEYLSDFQEQNAGDFQSMAFFDNSGRGSMSVVKLSKGIFIELATRGDSEMLKNVQSTFKHLK